MALAHDLSLEETNALKDSTASAEECIRKWLELHELPFCNPFTSIDAYCMLILLSTYYPHHTCHPLVAHPLVYLLQSQLWTILHFSRNAWLMRQRGIVLRSSTIQMEMCSGSRP